MNFDGFQLDRDNLEFRYAVELVEKTSQNLYLTGKAGTGKTTFLKYIKRKLKKQIVVVAPTGVAAVNAEGTTIHSFFKIPFGPFTPDDYRLRTRANKFDGDKSTIYDHFNYSQEKREIINSMDLLVIDEISMVRCDLLDVIDRLLRVYRKMPISPFGGVQVLFIGDAFQLAPIARGDEWEILRQFYDSPYFFNSRIIEAYPPVYIELQKIYRQNEPEFIDLLNKIRIGQVSGNDLFLINQRYTPSFDPGNLDHYITLGTHNRQVKEINRSKLEALITDSVFYEAKITGLFPDQMQPTEEVLEVKKGAQVMFVRNNYVRNYFNGKIGKVSECDEEKLLVVFDDGEEIQAELETWKNIQYQWNADEKKIEEIEIGTFTQYPVKLAWAVTVHKSQGLTFDKVIADVGASFTSGQVYVALSRCTTLKGLVLKTRLHRRAIRTDPVVLRFAEQLTPEAVILRQLEEGKIEQLYKIARKCFLAMKFEQAIENLIYAVHLRDETNSPEFKRFLRVHLRRIQQKGKIKYMEKCLDRSYLENKFKPAEVELICRLKESNWIQVDNN